MAKSKKTVGKESPNFEQALGELEALVAAMESGDMTLEESLQAFETGVRLTRECQQTLQQAEQKVQLLLADDGTTTAFPSISAASSISAVSGIATVSGIESPNADSD